MTAARPAAPLVVDPAGHVTVPLGFVAGAGSADVRGHGDARLDVAILYSREPCASAALFTRSAVRSATVQVCVEHAQRPAPSGLRAVIVNSGNANASTGPQGLADARRMTEVVAATLGLDPREVGVASTGVIGRPLPIERIATVVPGMKLSRVGGARFAQAIMTTDTRPKQVAVEFSLGDASARVAGCAKGSGMIHPDLGTTLAFITTDVAVPANDLRRWLTETADDTFNMVTVDGDTSPSDTLLCFANGASGLSSSEPDVAAAFRDALEAVCRHLARSIAADGEGAGHLIEVRTVRAPDREAARRVARTIAGSMLVKSAIHGRDPNWGRVVAAAGRAGVPLVEERMSVDFAGVRVFDCGRPLPIDEPALRQALAAPEVSISVDLGLGEAAATAWGCDLTPEYVHINADYTT